MQDNELRLQINSDDSALAIGTAVRTLVKMGPDGDCGHVARAAQRIASAQGQHVGPIDRELGMRSYGLGDIPQYDPTLGPCYVSGVPGVPEIRTAEELAAWLANGPDEPRPLGDFIAELDAILMEAD